MRFGRQNKKVRLRTTRVKKRFLWLPKEIDGEWRFLRVQSGVRELCTQALETL